MAVGGVYPRFRGPASIAQAVGTATIASASDTIATGLATVTRVIVSMVSAPTVNIVSVAGDPGNQSGAPVAGSFLLKSYKPTDAAGSDSDQTPTAATTFSDNIVVHWVAYGTY